MLKKLASKKRNRQELALVAKNFDESYYLANHPDAAVSGLSAFDHFMQEGWKRGYDPAPWFSIEAYLQKYPDIAASGINPFRHFLVHGAREKRSLPRAQEQAIGTPAPARLTEEMERLAASGYFDAGHYRTCNPELGLEGADALQHFCQQGWREGRDPSRLFDLSYVEATFPRPFDANINPVIQFLDSGLEGRYVPNPHGLTLSPAPKAPEETAWDGVASGVRDHDGATDVIVPVYRGYDETLRCLFSLLSAANDADANVIVIDDKSPEPVLSAKLAELAGRGLFSLLVNTENLGFVGTVNRGMRLHDRRDVVLLNADTEVYDHWLDRLLAHAGADERIATITPLSNNATICSYPVTLEGNRYALELPNADLDRTAAEVNKGHAVEVPTGVGFCFYIRRAALSAVGLFDEAAFAKGYGEENDFCVRATAAGWRNILALDTYVRHHGEVSFAADAGQLQAKGLEALNRKHPSYLSEVSRYIRRDPAARGRARLDAARIKRAKGDIALFVSHDWSGGIERNIRDLSAKLRAEGMDVVVLRSTDHRSEHVSFDAGPGFLTPALEELHLFADADLIGEILAVLTPRLIHVHSLIGFTPDARDAAMALIRGLEVPYYFTFHDYAPICAHGQFVTPAGDYCGNPGEAGCRTCLKRFPPLNGWADVGRYQATYRDFILGAEAVFAPSADAAHRADSFLGQARCTASAHPEMAELGAGPGGDHGRPTKAEREMTRVALIGALGPHKGRYVMEDCARDSAGRDLPLAFRLIGYTDTGDTGQPRLTISGKYQDDAACLDLLLQYKPQFVAFFSIWPETYSYALSLAFRANIPPVVFDLGAMAERVKAAGFGHCLPPEWKDDPARINDFLLANPVRPLPKREHQALIRTMAGKAPGSLLSPAFYRRLA